MIELLNELKEVLQGNTIVVGVSTGVDSMTLLSLLEEVKNKFNFHLVVAHINHKKREQSEVEEEFIKTYCTKHYLTCYVHHLDHYDASFQEQARKERLAFFYEVMEQEKSKYLFLAHHLDDDMETIFMRIARGSSPKGYCGMEKITLWKENKWIVRPFLETRKQEITTYANNHHLTYFEDESNKQDDYTRNRFRHHLLPWIFAENPSFDDQFLELKHLFEYTYRQIKKECELFIDQFVRKKNGYWIPVSSFLAEPKMIQEEILFTLFKEYHLSKKNVEEIIQYFHSSRSLNLHYKGLHFMKQYDQMRICDGIKLFSFEQMIDHAGIYPIDDHRTLIVTFEDFYQDEKKNINNLTNLSIVWYNKVDLPLKIRTRKKGDRIKLKNGTRKIKDIFIDEKISYEDRENAILLEGAEILAVFGIKKSITLQRCQEKNMKLELRENK